MLLNEFVRFTKLDLMPGVPLYVYVVKGSEYSILIDTGISAMKDQILRLCSDAGNVKVVLITHAHADHIGCNRAVKEATGALFFAAGALPWIEDMDIHYNEFCIPSEHLPDTPEQRAEILGLMDGSVNVDGILNPGSVFRPGSGIELHTIPFPGHKLEEVAFLEKNSGTLVMGDLLLAIAAPFFHGFQTARGFMNSLKNLEMMIHNNDVKTVLAAHHAPMDQEAALKSIIDTRKVLIDVRHSVLSNAKGVMFPELWKNVCGDLNKQLEFRGFAMMQVQVNELISEGFLFMDDNRIFVK